MTDTTTEAVERLAETAAAFHATRQPKIEAGDNYKSAVFKMGFRSGYAAILAERDAARQDRDEAMAFAHATARYAKDRAEKAEAEAILSDPRVKALVEAATPYVSTVQTADYARQLRQHEALVSALASLKGYHK